MAFRDITKLLYGDSIKLDYKDKSHRYYIRKRIDWDMDRNKKEAWGKAYRPTGVTTILGDTLEKKGLMTWPLGVAIRELFGFYDFDSDNLDEEGKPIRMTGFSRDVGTLWVTGDDGVERLNGLTKEEATNIIKSANDGWQRAQKKGADIGSVVHDAIEHYVLAHTNNPDIPNVDSVFDIAENYNWLIKESVFDNEAAEKKAWEEAPAEVEQAKVAFNKFIEWWDTTQPILYGAEDLLYSKEYDFPGTYDGDLGIKREHHPMFKDLEGDPIIRVTTDWKTSKASKSIDAGAPEGVYYSYFIQLALYEIARREMGFPPADDLLTVSARKDGGFSLVYASELGLSVQECIDWAVCVITCFRMAKKTKAALLRHAPEEEK